MKLSIYILLIFIGFNKQVDFRKPVSKKRTSYYFSNNGNDKNDGSFKHPLKTIAFLNQLKLNAGDSILFKSGNIFSGNIEINNTATIKKPVVITFYGNGKAIIDAGNNAAITINNSAYITIKNLKCIGAGRKAGNITNGILIEQSNHLNISDVDISGFQKAGLQIYKSYYINAVKVFAHDNGYAGISVSGENEKDQCAYVHISYCKAEIIPVIRPT